MDYVSLLDEIAHKADAREIGENDYTDSEGYIVCGSCGGRKQVYVPLLERKVRCLCKCEAGWRNQQEAEEKKRRAEEERRAVFAPVKVLNIQPNRLKQAYFANYAVNANNEKAFMIARRYVNEFKYNSRGLMIFGTVGTGKSYLASCIANELEKKGVLYCFTSMIKIISKSFDEEEAIDLLATINLLIIDDLGAERKSEYALERVYDVIDSRYNSNRPIIVTSNMTPREMLNTDNITLKRIYDRLFEQCDFVEINGESYRMQEARKRYSENR